MTDRFVISPDGETVLDQSTGLTWQHQVPAERFTWAAAKKYAAVLDLAGGGWRLPTVRELSGLVDYDRSDPAIDLAAFPDTPSERFWTASPDAGGAGNAWYVSFKHGYVYDYGVDFIGRVRCVR